MDVDPIILAELRSLVLALAEDLDEGIARGDRCDYTGGDLRAHFRTMARLHGLEVTLAAVRRHYDHQVRRCEAPPLLGLAPQTASSSEPGGAG